MGTKRTDAVVLTMALSTKLIANHLNSKPSETEKRSEELFKSTTETRRGMGDILTCLFEGVETSIFHTMWLECAVFMVLVAAFAAIRSLTWVLSESVAITAFVGAAAVCVAAAACATWVFACMNKRWTALSDDHSIKVASPWVFAAENDPRGFVKKRIDAGHYESNEKRYFKAKMEAQISPTADVIVQATQAAGRIKLITFVALTLLLFELGGFLFFTPDTQQCAARSDVRGPGDDREDVMSTAYLGMLVFMFVLVLLMWIVRFIVRSANGDKAASKSSGVDCTDNWLACVQCAALAILFTLCFMWFFTSFSSGMASSERSKLNKAISDKTADLKRAQRDLNYFKAERNSLRTKLDEAESRERKVQKTLEDLKEKERSAKFAKSAKGEFATVVTKADDAFAKSIEACGSSNRTYSRHGKNTRRMCAELNLAKTVTSKLISKFGEIVKTINSNKGDERRSCADQIQSSKDEMLKVFQSSVNRKNLEAQVATQATLLADRASELQRALDEDGALHSLIQKVVRDNALSLVKASATQAPHGAVPCVVSAWVGWWAPQITQSVNVREEKVKDVGASLKTAVTNHRQMKWLAEASEAFKLASDRLSEYDQRGVDPLSSSSSTSWGFLRKAESFKRAGKKMAQAIKSGFTRKKKQLGTVGPTQSSSATVSLARSRRV